MKTANLLISLLFSVVGPSLANATNGPVVCTIQTVNGNYLTAVGGGGRVDDVLHTDATRAAGWEKFTLVDSGSGGAIVEYGIRTQSGHYLTAVGAGGRITDTFHSDATQLNDWEKFKFISLGRGWYAIQTNSGRYVTAVSGGGRTYDVLHTDSTWVKAWEKFRVRCRH